MNIKKIDRIRNITQLTQNTNEFEYQYIILDKGKQEERACSSMSMSGSEGGGPRRLAPGMFGRCI